MQPHNDTLAEVRLVSFQVKEATAGVKELRNRMRNVELDVARIGVKVAIFSTLGSAAGAGLVATVLRFVFHP